MSDRFRRSGYHQLLRPGKRCRQGSTVLSAGKHSLPYGNVLAWLSDVYFGKLSIRIALTWQLYVSGPSSLVLDFRFSTGPSGNLVSPVWPAKLTLALAGSELALLVNLSGYTLAMSSARNYVTSRTGMLSHGSIMVLGGSGHLLPSDTGMGTFRIRAWYLDRMAGYVWELSASER